MYVYKIFITLHYTSLWVYGIFSKGSAGSDKANLSTVGFQIAVQCIVSLKDVCFLMFYNIVY